MQLSNHGKTSCHLPEALGLGWDEAPYGTGYLSPLIAARMQRFSLDLTRMFGTAKGRCDNSSHPFWQVLLGTDLHKACRKINPFRYKVMSSTCDQVSKKLDSVAQCWKSMGTAASALERQEADLEESRGRWRGSEMAQEEGQPSPLVHNWHRLLLTLKRNYKCLKATSVPSASTIILSITDSSGFVLMFL